MSGDTTVYITRTGKKYHRDGCRYLSQSKIPIDIKDAVARGLTPGSVCNAPRYDPSLDTSSAPQSSSASSFDTVFSGRAGSRNLVAVSVSRDYGMVGISDAFSAYAGTGMTLLVYRSYKQVSSAEPIAVFVNGELHDFKQTSARSTSSPTITDEISGGYRTSTGGRTGAVCRDGSRSSATGWGAYSRHGGVARWFSAGTGVKDESATVAAISTDFRLVSGDGDRCGGCAAAPGRAGLSWEGRDRPLERNGSRLPSPLITSRQRGYADVASPSGRVTPRLVGKALGPYNIIEQLGAGGTPSPATGFS